VGIGISIATNLFREIEDQIWSGSFQITDHFQRTNEWVNEDILR